jgi:hypothetical protein
MTNAAGELSDEVVSYEVASVGVLATRAVDLGKVGVGMDPVVPVSMSGPPKVLAEMRLSASDMIRLLLVRVTAEKALPFAIKANAEMARRWRSSSDGQARHSTAWPILWPI